MSFWQRLAALFHLDFRSDFVLSGKPPAPETGSAERYDKIPLPFELDAKKLNYIQYRQQVLDWRDEFSAQMLADGKNMFWKFCEHVEKEADKVGIIGKLVSKPAAEVLKDDFFTLVRSPLVERVRAAEVQLGKVIQSRPPARFTPVSLTVEEVDPSLDILRKLRFRPSNKDEILAKLHHLVSGECGVIDCYLQRAQTVSISLLQAMTN